MKIHWIKNRIHLLLFAILLTLFVASCRDYSNRTYHYHDYIPIKPFIMKVLKTEYQMQENSGMIRVFIEVQNKHFEKESLDKNRFYLRTESEEIPHEKDLREKVGLETISFNPTELAVITVAFPVPAAQWNQRFDLILDYLPIKKTKSYTLVYLKSPGSIPKPNPNWTPVESTNW